ncbi:MAG TPA: hypothetical protein VIE66_02555 [Methylocella sp.]|jgi:hypothetical protein
MRIWFSGPRLLNGLVRPGISFGREDFGPPRLPSWRRHELRAGLQSAAKARGEAMTKDDANYYIDKALALGVLDRNGNLGFKVKGSRDECVATIEATAASWGKNMTREEAQAVFDDTIDKQRYHRQKWFWAIALNLFGFWALYEAFK